MADFESIVDDISFGLQEFSQDVRSSIESIDLQTIGVVLIVLLAIIIIYDIIAYISLTNSVRSFSPTILSLAGQAWEHRNELGINPSKYISGRTLEVINPVLMAVQSAIEKYEQ